MCIRDRHIYIYFYSRTLSALPHDCMPTLEPGTRSRISTRFTAPGHEAPRNLWGGAPRAGGRISLPSGDVCAEPLRLEAFSETRGVPSLGAGPSQNGTCSGVASVGRSGPGEVLLIIFRSGGPESVYASQSASSEKIDSFGTVPQQAVVSWSYY